MNNIDKLVHNNSIAEVKLEILNVADVVTPEATIVIAALKRKIAKYEVINVNKMRNKLLEIERTEARLEKMKYENYLIKHKACMFKPLNKSQLETIRILEDAEKMGILLTPKEVRMIKKERRIQAKIVHPMQEVRYFNILEERVGRRGMCIILMAVIWIIKARCPMSRNARKYQLKAVALAKAQSDNTLGYFDPAFDGLDTMIESNGLMLTVIKNYEKHNGSATTEDVTAAKALVKISVDALIFYVNSLCIKDQKNSLSIIANAGMIPRKQRAKNTKADFSLKHGASGEIILTSLAAKFNGKKVHATYYWQYGLMIEGVLTWFDLPETMNQCKTTATGMPIDVTVYFRKSIQTKKGGRGDWCDKLGISPR